MATKKIAATKTTPAKKTPATKPTAKLPDDDVLLDLDVELGKLLKPRKPGTNNPGPMFRSELDVIDFLRTDNPGPSVAPTAKPRRRGTDNPGPTLRRNDDDFGIE